MLEFALALLLLAATPGPGTLTVTTAAATRGFRAGAGCALGIVAGDCLFLLLSIGGLAVLARTVGVLFLAIRIAGCAYLLLLGLRLLIATKTLSQTDEGRPVRAARNIAGGFALTMANPKAMLFYLSFLPSLVDLPQVSVTETVALLIEMSFVVGSVLLTYAAIAAHAGARSMRSKAAPFLRRIAGVVMIGAGVRIAVN